jgi:phosphoribosyl-AMP cyclohydrolase
MKGKPAVSSMFDTKKLTSLVRLMPHYDDSHNETQEPIMPELEENERLHLLVMHNKSVFHTNEQCQQVWLHNAKQPIWNKGNGQAVHISNFLVEATRQLVLSEAQQEENSKLDEGNGCLKEVDARKIIYPGKNHDLWWDMPQLLGQVHLP